MESGVRSAQAVRYLLPGDGCLQSAGGLPWCTRAAADVLRRADMAERHGVSSADGRGASTWGWRLRSADPSLFAFFCSLMASACRLVFRDPESLTRVWQNMR